MFDNNSGTWEVLYRHLLNFQNPTTHAPIENLRIPAFVDNWTRLGLVDVDYAKYVATEKIYDWVEQRPEFLRLKTERENDASKVTFQKGVIARTSLGEQFAAAVGVIANQIPGK